MGSIYFVYQLSVQKHWTSACIQLSACMSLLHYSAAPATRSSFDQQKLLKTVVCSVCAKIRMSCTYAKEHSGVEEFWWDIIHKIVPPKEEDI